MAFVAVFTLLIRSGCCLPASFCAFSCSTQTSYCCSRMPTVFEVSGTGLTFFFWLGIGYSHFGDGYISLQNWLCRYRWAVSPDWIQLWRVSQLFFNPLLWKKCKEKSKRWARTGGLVDWPIVSFPNIFSVLQFTMRTNLPKTLDQLIFCKDALNIL